MLEQRRVIDVRNVVLGETHPPGQCGGKEAGAHGFFRRVAAAEVRGDGEGDQQVGQAEVATCGVGCRQVLLRSVRWQNRRLAEFPATG